MFYTTKEQMNHVDYKQSEAEYPPFEFEGMKSNDSFNMIKSDQHKLTGVHCLHILNHPQREMHQ